MSYSPRYTYMNKGSLATFSNYDKYVYCSYATCNATVDACFGDDIEGIWYVGIYSGYYASVTVTAFLNIPGT